MVFCPPNSFWQHEIVQSCCKLVSGSGVKVGPAVFTRPAREDPEWRTRASCKGSSMWMSSRGLGMLDYVAGCAVVKFQLWNECIHKAEMGFLQASHNGRRGFLQPFPNQTWHFLKPFHNKRMCPCPWADSRYPIVTPLTIFRRISPSCWQVDKCSLRTCM